MTSKTIDEAEFERRFGRKPQNDDLDRVNCTSPGVIGHFMCGICEHDRPCFECTVCFARRMLDVMKLEELRHLLAETKAPENAVSVSDVRIDYGSGDSVGRATLNRRKGEIWERIGVDVVLSDDPDPEALQYARKCACGNMRDVVRDTSSTSVHAILPCIQACELAT